MKNILSGIILFCSGVLVSGTVQADSIMDNEVRASDTDEHYLRNITFRDRNRASDFYSLSADIGYYITPQAKVFIEGEWVRVTNGKGGDTAEFHNEGVVEYFPDSSGIESSSYNVTAGLKYYF